MIDLYTFATSNGRKASIMLEEVGLPYETHLINILEGDQFKPEFVAINPNAKIPAIVDREGPGGAPYTVIESGAILLYLAEKTGRLMPQDMAARYEVIQWLMLQMGGVGPIFGQTHHFRRSKPEETYSVERYTTETKRLYGVLDGRLAGRDYLAGEYSIADIATYPWVVRYEWQDVALEDYPNVKRWYDAISARPAVERGLGVGMPPPG